MVVLRCGITAAASAMQRSGLIEYHRGEMLIRARSGLEAVACACYGNHQRAYGDVRG